MQAKIPNERKPMNETDLTQLQNRTKALVSRILGGYGLQKKLETLGIRVGCEVEKLSAQALRGPIILKIGNAQVAIGFGMAKRIIVKYTDMGQKDANHNTKNDN